MLKNFRANVLEPKDAYFFPLSLGESSLLTAVWRKITAFKNIRQLYFILVYSICNNYSSFYIYNANSCKHCK